MFDFGLPTVEIFDKPQTSFYSYYRSITLFATAHIHYGAYLSCPIAAAF